MTRIGEAETREAILRPGARLIDSVGQTPLVRLRHVTAALPPRVEVYAKAEWTNPAGSVKDRPAVEILNRALEAGLLGDGRTLLDSTSGNMGVAYATYARTLGVSVRLAIPANADSIRLATLRALGADLVLTDPLEGSDGAREVAAEIAATSPDSVYYADQYSNPANWQAHYQTTGPEILRQTKGRLTSFIAGLGTTGTMTGTGRFLQERAPEARLVAVQPDAPLHGLEGLKHLDSSPVPPIYDASVPHEVISIRTEDAYEMAVRLAQEEGLLVGVSSAAAALAALEVGQRIETGVVVALFPDSGLRYLDQPFWSQRA